MAGDPIEIIAEEIRVQRETGAPEMSPRTHGAGAWLILNALYEAGWRIVRAGADREDLDDDPDSPTYGQMVRVVDVADEWTPTGDWAVSTGEDPT